MKAVPISRHSFHGEWNYTIHGGPIPESVQGDAIDPKPTK